MQMQMQMHPPAVEAVQSSCRVLLAEALVKMVVASAVPTSMAVALCSA